MLDKVLDKIKEIIGMEKFDNTEILIVTNDKLSDGITFKNGLILITCVLKDDGKLYPWLFLEEALVAWKIIDIDTF